LEEIGRVLDSPENVSFSSKVWDIAAGYKTSYLTRHKSSYYVLRQIFL
jgi:hypothetical protein